VLDWLTPINVAVNQEFYVGHWERTLKEPCARAEEFGAHFLEDLAIEGTQQGRSGLCAFLPAA